MVEAADIHQYCKVGGYNEVLECLVHVDIEGKIRVKELDLEQEVVLDFILKDIKQEHENGMMFSSTKYRGKHPRRWFGFLYPDMLDPHLFGIFLKKIFLGWFTLVRSPNNNDWVPFGICLVEKYRGKGLGKAILYHAFEMMEIIYESGTKKIFLVTKLQNEKMRYVANRMKLEVHDDPFFQKYYMDNGIIGYIMKENKLKNK